MNFAPNPSFMSSPEQSTNEQVETFYRDIKNQIQNGESITSYDVNVFYGLFESPGNLTVDRVNNLFTLLEQAASAEKFESKELADNCLGAIATYRHNFAL